METGIDLDEIRTLARDFAQTELRPHTERWDHDRLVDPAAFAQLAELGFFGMLVPETHGGMGFDLPAYVAVLEELARGEASVAVAVAKSASAAALLDRFGNSAQKSEWLETIAAGTAAVAVAVAEDQAGDDTVDLETTASRHEDGWSLNGTKRWVTNGGQAALTLVYARDEDGRSSLFLVPRTASGYEVGARDDTLGLRPLELVTVQFSDVRVDTQACLGNPGDANAQLAAVQPITRAGIAAIALGIAQAALDHALEYASVREQFNTRLKDFEGIQFKLADMATRIAAARALLMEAAVDGDASRINMAKVFASESAMWVTTQAVQIFGGYGYMRDYPVEKLMRDAKAMEMMEGSNEVIRVAIAKQLYAD